MNTMLQVTLFAGLFVLSQAQTPITRFLHTKFYATVYGDQYGSPYPVNDASNWNMFTFKLSSNTFGLITAPDFFNRDSLRIKQLNTVNVNGVRSLGTPEGNTYWVWRYGKVDSQVAFVQENLSWFENVITPQHQVYGWVNKLLYGHMAFWQNYGGTTGTVKVYFGTLTTPRIDPNAGTDNNCCCYGDEFSVSTNSPSSDFYDSDATCSFSGTLSQQFLKDIEPNEFECSYLCNSQTRCNYYHYLDDCGTSANDFDFGSYTKSLGDYSPVYHGTFSSHGKCGVPAGEDSFENPFLCDTCFAIGSFGETSYYATYNSASAWDIYANDKQCSSTPIPSDDLPDGSFLSSLSDLNIECHDSDTIGSCNVECCQHYGAVMNTLMFYFTPSVLTYSVDFEAGDVDALLDSLADLQLKIDSKVCNSLPSIPTLCAPLSVSLLCGAANGEMSAHPISEGVRESDHCPSPSLSTCDFDISQDGDVDVLDVIELIEYILA